MTGRPWAKVHADTEQHRIRYPIGESGNVSVAPGRVIDPGAVPRTSGAASRPDMPEVAPAADEALLVQEPKGGQSSPIGQSSRPSGIDRAAKQSASGARSRGASSKLMLEDRIDIALCIVAELLEHDDAYLPIFLRLEAEREKADARSAALSRARSFLKPHA